MTELTTRITKLLGTRYPIVQAGMAWASGWRLASAVSEAGGFGIIGSGSMEPDFLAEQIKKTRAATSRPFGVNVPVMHKNAADNIAVCLENRVHAVFTSAGSPKVFTRRLKDAGIKVIHVVPCSDLAKKVEAAGCDAVVAEGTEAGGHNGYEELTSIVLWPSVVDAVKIPVIAAGGIADGRSAAAALILGAEGVQLGTRFAVTRESSASEAYKEAAVSSGEGQARLYLRRFMPTRALANPYLERAIEAETSGASAEELSRILGRGRARRGILEGDLVEGELEIGQVSGRISDIPTAQDVVKTIADGILSAVQKLEHVTRGEAAQVNPKDKRPS